MVVPEPDTMRAEVTATNLRNAVQTSVIGIVPLIGSVAYLAHISAPYADPLLLAAWVGYMAVAIAVFLVATPLFVWRAPDAQASARFWSPLAHGFIFAIALGAIASVWILLPPAPPDQRELLVRFYFGFLVVLMLANSFLDIGIRFAVVGLLGSIIAFLLLYDVPRAVPQSVALAFFAVVVMSMRSRIRRASIAETLSRVRSEAAAAQSAQALEIVKAERDAKTRFIAAASHDLQQPLQAAHMFFEAALHTPAGAVREKSVAGARAAFQSTQALIEAMLEHLRLEAGAVPVRLTSLPIGPVMQQAADAQRAQALAAGIRLSVVGSRHWANADPALLERALANLLANAIRHSGGTRLLLGARARGGDIAIWVIDNGHGISGEDSERLFEDFAQGSGSAGGFGLGLASVRRQMALMGGAVALDRRWTGGAAFVVRLPKVAAPIQRRAAAAAVLQAA